MLTRRRLTWLLGLGAAAGTGFLLFGASDQRKILKALETLAAAAGSLRNDTAAQADARLRAALARYAVSDVHVSIADFGEAEGVEELVLLRARLEGADIEFHIEQSDVRVQAERAQATLSLIVRVRVLGRELTQQRTVNVDLIRRLKEYRVARVTVSEASHAEPEARP